MFYLENMSNQVLFPCFNWLFFILISYETCRLQTFTIIPLFVFLFFCCLFGCLLCIIFSSIMLSHLFIFAFLSELWCHSKMLLLKLISRSFPPGSFMTSSFIVKSLIYFESIFVWYTSSISLFYMCIFVFPITIFWRGSPFPIVYSLNAW